MKKLVLLLPFLLIGCYVYPSGYGGYGRPYYQQRCTPVTRPYYGTFITEYFCENVPVAAPMIAAPPAIGVLIEGGGERKRDEDHDGKHKGKGRRHYR